MHHRSFLGRALGLGASGKGVEPWLAQRITACLLVPLSIWFLICVTIISQGDYLQIQTFLSHWANATCMLMFLFCVFYHAYLGLKVIIEDYIPHPGLKVFLVLGIQFMAFFGIVIATFSMIKIVMLG